MAAIACSTRNTMSSPIPFFIGSYSIPSPWTGTPHAHGAGISRATLDPVSGEMRVTTSVLAINPSFLVGDPDRGLLWATTEPETGGEMLAFDVGDEGALTLLANVDTGADAPCHLAVDTVRRAAFVSHYHGGSVALMALDVDLVPIRSLARYTPRALAGRGAEEISPRPHASVRIAEDELLIADAGLDQLLLYRLLGDGATSQLALVDSLQLAEGTGPRHIAWRDKSDTAFVSNQNDGSVTIIDRVETDLGPKLRFNSVVESGSLGRSRSIPSEIALHPNGSALYMANRFDDSLSVFSVSDTGGLELRDTVDAEGVNPRYFRLTDDGRFLLITNQDSDDITSFRVSEDGLNIEWTGERLSVATPTCVAFW
jgi:6-phosphogluconolactonase